MYDGSHGVQKEVQCGGFIGNGDGYLYGISRGVCLGVAFTLIRLTPHEAEQKRTNKREKERKRERARSSFRKRYIINLELIYELAHISMGINRDLMRSRAEAKTAAPEREKTTLETTL